MWLKLEQIVRTKSCLGVFDCDKKVKLLSHRSTSQVTDLYPSLDISQIMDSGHYFNWTRVLSTLRTSRGLICKHDLSMLDSSVSLM